MIALDAELARLLARAYVRKLLRQGYTVEKAQAEGCSGSCGPGFPGYTMHHGKISVPCLSPNWTFSFADIVRSLENPEQMTLL